MDMKEIAQWAVEAMSAEGVDYGDARLRQTDREIIMTQNDALRYVDNFTELGIGVRVLVKGRWGFAATPFLTKEDIRKTVKKAVAIAKAASVVVQEPIKLTQDKPARGVFKTKIEKDPFDIPLGEKAGMLIAAYEKMAARKAIKRVSGRMYFRRMHQYFLSTEGADLENLVYTSAATYNATAVGQGDFQTRGLPEYPKNAGFEWIESLNIVDRADEVAEDVMKKLSADRGPAGKKDLILLPSHLCLTIHESVGHPTELDRVLGWEANFAGTSFATPEKRNQFRYGSPLVNFVADNTLEGGLATWGNDDDGIVGKRWPIIKDGILVNYGTTRDTAHFIGDAESMGCNRADSYASQPINRIPNLSLEPGKEPLSLDELIADTEDGILIDGMGSFSIDQRRYNFQFGGDMFYEIKKGKITKPLKDVIYQAITPEFWNACDAVCDKRFWEPYGVLNCGKGEPSQTQQMTHGSAPARFRNIAVGGAFNG